MSCYRLDFTAWLWGHTLVVGKAVNNVEKGLWWNRRRFASCLPVRPPISPAPVEFGCLYRLYGLRSSACNWSNSRTPSILHTDSVARQCGTQTVGSLCVQCQVYYRPPLPSAGGRTQLITQSLASTRRRVCGSKPECRTI